MAKNTSIDITVKDTYTQKITTIRSTPSAFNKDLTELSDRLDALNRVKVKLKIDAEKAKTAMKEMEKQFIATTDAADGLARKMDQADYSKIQHNLEDISKKARQAETSLKDLKQIIDSLGDKKLSFIVSFSYENPNFKSEGNNGLVEQKSSASNYDTLLKLSERTLNILDHQRETQWDPFISMLDVVADGVPTSPDKLTGFATSLLIAPLVTEIKNMISYFQTRSETKDDAFKSYVNDQFNSLLSNRATSLFSGTLNAASHESQAYNALDKFGSPANADRLFKTLAETGVDAFQTIADMAGITRDEAIRAYGKWSSGIDSYVQTFEKYNEAQNGINNAKGEGYTDVRGEGLKAQTSWDHSEYGFKLETANKMIGKSQAYLENEKEAIQRDALEAIFGKDIQNSSNFSEKQKQQLQTLSAQYTEAVNAFNGGDLSKGTTVQSLLDSATGIAEDAYNVSTGAVTAQDADMAMYANLQVAAASMKTGDNIDYWNKLISETEMMSLSLQTIQSALSTEKFWNNVYNYFYEYGSISDGYVPPAAYGLSYVPYDNFPAKLHEGERVLTASENRAYNNSSASVVISGNSFTIREEADIEKVAKAIVRKMSHAYAVAI